MKQTPIKEPVRGVLIGLTEKQIAWLDSLEVSRADAIRSLIIAAMKKPKA